MQEALAHELASGAERGAAVCALVDGEPVVDIWGGARHDGTTWERDTLACFFSVTKGLTALCAQMLDDRGRLDVDAPIAEYWPEFAANGKERVLVRHALSHTAGLLTVPRWWELSGDHGEGLADDVAVAEALAAAPLSWEPGTAAGYHALTYGWLVGELVRRIDGRSIGRFFAEEVAGPLGLELFIGLPPGLDDRVTDSIALPQVELTDELRAVHDKGWAAAEADDLTVLEAAGIGSTFPPRGTEKIGEYLTALMNDPTIRHAELPAGNGIGTARSLARMYAVLAAGGSFGGVELVSPETIERWRTRTVLPDGTALDFGLGYAVYAADETTGAGDGRFGHGGAGGSLGFAHPERRLAYGWTKNKMRMDHGTRVIQALYTCLDAAG